MGWLFTYGESKAAVIKELIEPQENEMRRRDTLAHCVRGKVLWPVIEITDEQARQSKRPIVCHLLAKQKDCG